MTSPAVSNAIPIHTGQDFYVPAFEVRIGERELDREAVFDITQVTYKDELGKIDSFDIVINNWNAAKRTFKYSDGDMFMPGKTIDLRMGYFGRGDIRRMLTGRINSLRPAFPAAGVPTLTISGNNILDSLRRAQDTDVYEKMTDNQIAQTIATRLGLDIRVDENGAGQTKEYEYIIQENKYDILFLLERAQRIGYDLFVEENESGGSQLHFGPSQNLRRPTYQLHYGNSLIDFQPTLTTTNQVGKVTVQGWDPVRKTPIRVTVTRDEIRTQGVGSEGGQVQLQQAFEDREEVISDRPVRDEQEARTLALQTLEAIAKGMVTGSGSVVGLPDLRAGSIVQLSGMGTRFTGTYFVTATTHSIGDGGYTTKFDCRREET